MFYYVPYDTKRKVEMITFEEWALSAPPGWRNLLEDLAVKLLDLGWDGGLLQVKEKFGTLRFYWRNNIPEGVRHEIANDVVENAEDKSAYVCQECGKWGLLRNDGWVSTLCDECYGEDGK